MRTITSLFIQYGNIVLLQKSFISWITSLPPSTSPPIKPLKIPTSYSVPYREIHAPDIIVYVFAHLHTTLRTEENLLGIY